MHLNFTSGRKISILYYLAALVLLWACVFIAFPFFQYYVDPDATSYLTIVNHYLNGNYQDAINAFWSPLGCWLTVLLVKVSGYPLFTAAIIVNTIAASGTLVFSQALFFRFRKDNFERLCFTAVSALFWTYAVYKQSFTDLWQYLFIIAGILLLLLPAFTKRPLLWIMTGIIAALAYYGKAYSFYFFPLMVLATLFIKLRHEDNFTKKKWLGISGVIIVVMVGFVFPWAYLLHEKYGIWTTSTAGTLNLSWWLTGHPEYRPDIKILLPPPHASSVFSFEDPYLLQGHFEHFWDSPRSFLKQLIRIGYNGITWIESCNILSPFYFITWLITIIFLGRKKQAQQFFDLPSKIIAWIFLLYPLAFWLMTFDNGRYLWVTLPIGMILGLTIAEKLLFPNIGKVYRRIFTAVFFISFITGIVPDMKVMFHTGEEEYKIARLINKSGIKGSFTTNYAISGSMGQYILRIAYFSQCPVYCYGENKWTEQEIIADAKRYDVKYYFYFYNDASSEYQLKDQQGMPLHEITGGKISGLKIFELK